MPPGFAFAIKASRYLTHVKRLRELPDGIERLYERIEPVVARGCLGCVLWQRRRPSTATTSGWRAPWRPCREGRHAFEFRHPSWFCGEVYELLRGAGAALVVGDDPERPFQTEELTAPFTYLRFHRGGAAGAATTRRRSSRSGRRIRGWRRDVDVYAYFNNDWEGFAPRNAETLQALLA